MLANLEQDSCLVEHHQRVLRLQCESLPQVAISNLSDSEDGYIAAYLVHECKRLGRFSLSMLHKALVAQQHWTDGID